MAIFTAIATAIATGLGMTLAAATTATFITVTSLALQALTYFGGLALSMTLSKKSSADYGASSPTYANGVIQTQTNQDLPIPLLYGTCKLAGNRIWQHDENTKTIRRIVAFAEGEICEFSDIRLNDIEVNKISGISINKYYGTSTQTIDPIIDGNTHEKRAEIVGSLRNLAYLAISVPRSNDIDANYNLTAIVKGRKIRVYNAPNPTSFEIKYSENPAWIMLDFLTSYNGLGLCLNNDGTLNNDVLAELFDLQSFIESADFCDEEIEYTDSDGNIKKTPRFTFNMVFDSQTSARDLIDEIYRSCRGGLFTKNGKLQFKIDKAEPVSKVFTADDIVKGSETFSTIPTEEHYDILKLVYISPEHEYQKVEAFAEIPDYRDGVPIEHSVNCYSITNFQQASRLAWYYINSKRLCPYFGSFKTDYRAYDLEVGDVIKFDSLLMGLNEYLAKVTSVVDDGAGIFTVNWKTYDERLYSDELGSKEPRVLVSKLKDMYTPPDDVKNFNVVQSQTFFNMTWSKQSSVTYEIRFGDSWDNSTLIARNIHENTFTWKIPTTGIYKFWIKAFNGYSYSTNATLDVCAIDSIVDINEIVKFDLFENLNGVYEETYLYRGAIKLKTNNIIWHDTPNRWGDETYFQNIGYWGADVKNVGSYTSQIYDIKRKLKSVVSFETQYYSSDDSQDILFEWRYSEDGITYTDWVICNGGEYTFRYCQFRATLRAYNNVQILLTKFLVIIDVPEKEELLEVEIPESGYLEISYDFVRMPSIVGTVNDNISAYVVVKDKTNTGAKIFAYLNDETATSAKVNLRLRGY